VAAGVVVQVDLEVVEEIITLLVLLPGDLVFQVKVIAEEVE